ncbi:alpha/beta fold hydrolase [Amycolatopsis sp. NPDC004378]
MNTPADHPADRGHKRAPERAAAGACELVTADAHDMAVAYTGTGSPLLALHGGAGPDSLAPLVQRLAQRHRVLVPYHPGWDPLAAHGDLGTHLAGPAGPAAIAELAHRYRALLASLEQPATVLGSSFGGWIATEVAIQDSETADACVAGLVLIAGIGLKPATVPDPPIPTSAPGADRVRAITGDTPWDETLPGRLNRVRVPVLIICGENDPVAPPDYARAYARAFPAAELHVVPDAGHLPFRDAPDHVASLVLTATSQDAG